MTDVSALLPSLEGGRCPGLLRTRRNGRHREQAINDAVPWTGIHP